MFNFVMVHVCHDWSAWRIYGLWCLICGWETLSLEMALDWFETSSPLRTLNGISRPNCAILRGSRARSILRCSFSVVIVCIWRYISHHAALFNFESSAEENFVVETFSHSPHCTGRELHDVGPDKWRGRGE